MKIIKSIFHEQTRQNVISQSTSLVVKTNDPGTLIDSMASRTVDRDRVDTLVVDRPS